MNFKKGFIPIILICLVACKSAKISSNETIRTGTFSVNELQKEKWMRAEYKLYTPNDLIVDSLKLFDSYNIVIIGGEWCSDTRLQLPRFIKILDKIQFSSKNLTITLVDKSKECEKCEGYLKDKFLIRFVPTFIIYNKSNNEIGRIVETPIRSLEADLLKILMAKNLNDKK